MGIDWSKAPEGTTHALTTDEGVSWHRELDDSSYVWSGTLGWQLVTKGTADYWKGIFNYIEKPTLTLQQLRSLVQQSGLQIEFHADGTIYVWDDAHEAGTRVNSLDEYVRLAEAKAAYVKLWADYVWE